MIRLQPVFQWLFVLKVNVMTKHEIFKLERAEITVDVSSLLKSDSMFF